MRENGRPHPLDLFDNLRVGIMNEFADFRKRLPSPVPEFLDLRVNERRGGFYGVWLLHDAPILTMSFELETYERRLTASRRRQKKYESPQSTAVPAAQPHASGPSPTETCAIRAETSVIAKPAYAHSFSLAGTGARSR